MNLFSGKKGVSDVIATVLLILLTLTAIGVLATILIPFTQKNLEDSGNCLDALESIEIVHEDSCYSNSNRNTKVVIKAKNIEIEGLYIIAEDSTLKSFELINGKDYPSEIVGSSGTIVLPEKGGGEKTYTITGAYKKIVAGVMKNGKRCPNPAEDELKLCVN